MSRLTNAQLQEQIAQLSAQNAKLQARLEKTKTTKAPKADQPTDVDAVVAAVLKAMGQTPAANTTKAPKGRAKAGSGAARPFSIKGTQYVGIPGNGMNRNAAEKAFKAAGYHTNGLRFCNQHTMRARTFGEPCWTING